MKPEDLTTLVCAIGAILIMLVLWLLGLDTKPSDSLNELADSVVEEHPVIDDILD